MLRHRDILQGTHFTWVTDHKSLIHILDQKGLSSHQAWWLEKLSEFNFTVKYVAREENIFPDTLSRLYEYDKPETIHAPAEYSQYNADVETNAMSKWPVLSAPLLVGMEALAMSPRRSSRIQRWTSEGTPPLGQPIPPKPTPIPADPEKRIKPLEPPQPCSTRKGPPPNGRQCPHYGDSGHSTAGSTQMTMKSLTHLSRWFKLEVRQPKVVWKFLDRTHCKHFSMFHDKTL